MSRRPRRRRQPQQQQRPAMPYIVVSDDDEDSDDPAGPHPWPARTVAAAAAAAAAIARAVRATADTAVGAVPPVAQQPQSPRGVSSPSETPVAPIVAAAGPAAGPTPAAIAIEQDSSEPAQAEEVGSSCTICYEPMYEEGSHRAASLKCGHIFGSDCIRKWLQQKNKCPQCNQRCKPKEITLLYNLPKLAAGAAPDDIQRQLQELEASKRKEEQRAADLERSLKELQRQLAVREHQQLQQHQPPAAHLAAGLGMQLWQQQRLQRLPLSGPVRPPSDWSDQQQLLQQLLRQHQRLPLQPIPSEQNHYMVQSAAAALWQQQPQLVGQKRPWEQMSTLAPQQQQQPQAAAVEVPITWPLLTLQPVTAAAAAACAIEPRIGVAGIPNTAAEHLSTQATGGFAVSAASGLTTTAAGPRRYLAGCFSTLQEFELCGSRSFYLDVAGTLALAAETPEQGGSRLRKISLVCPGQPSYTQLPADAGVVRCLASQKQLLGPGSSFDSSNINPNYLAVATDKAGLLIASVDTQNIVQSIPVSGPVWSVAWSPQHSQQLLLGLDKGRIAVADVRKSSSQALLFISNANSNCRLMQPLHSLIPLQRRQLLQIEGNNSSSGCEGPTWSDGSAPEAVVACAGGVYSWGRSSVDAFNLLLPSTAHGGNCESIALAPDGMTLAVSFRSPLRWGPPPPASAAGFGGFIIDSSSYAGFGSSLPTGTPMHVLCKLGKVTGLESLGLGISSADQSSTAAAAEEVAASMGTQAQQSQLLPTQPAQASTVAPVAAQAATVATGGLRVDPSAVEAGLKAAQEQLMQQTVKLYGHNSSKTLTHGCFIPGLPGADAELLYLSADEPSCQPCLWGCSSGALLAQRQPWQSLPGHILQLAWGQSDSLNALLVGAMSDRRLVLYDWQPDNQNL